MLKYSHQYQYHKVYIYDYVRTVEKNARKCAGIIRDADKAYFKLMATYLLAPKLEDELMKSQ